jgi:signal transduction histidine kinase
MKEAPKSILVVEDENIVAMDLHASLERLGYAVAGCVGTGAQAVESAESLRPALVVMDIHLRGEMDGIEAAALIRRKLDIPVIYVTAHSDDGTLRGAQLSEAYGYVLKPFDERELHVLIEMALFRHHAQKEHEKLLTEQAARAAVEKERRWLQFLAQAGERVSASLDLEATLEQIASLAVPDLADWAALHIEQKGRLSTLVIRHAGGQEELMAEVLRRYPPPSDAAHDYPQVIRTQRPEFLPNLRDELLVATAVDAEHLRLLRALGLRARICVPLVVRGESFGALTLALAGSERQYDVEDVDHAIQLARICASAIDNARLYESARSAIALRDEFLSVAAHELRTPLASMVLAFQSIERAVAKVDDAPLQRRTASVTKQFDRLVELVERLLDVSRLSAGKLDIRRHETDLGQLIREVAERFDEEARRAGSTLQVRGPDELLGHWDRTRIEQVLTNLLGNALKFCSGKPVELALESEAGKALLMVRDHGIGIPSEKLPHIFERFGRGVSARNYGGMGLGLYVARQLVEAHGGQIRVVSEVGEGTSFFVDLPRSLENAV